MSADDRLVQRVAGRGEDLEHRGAGIGVLAPQDAQQRRALLGRGAPVNDMHALAVALVDGPWPAKDPGGSQPVEPRRPVEAGLDVEHGETPAMAVGRQRIELAWAAIVAIAVAEFAPFDLP